MKQYRLLSGTHEQDFVTYQAGEIIETSHDLDKLFVNKFQVIEEPVITKKKKTAVPATPPEEILDDVDEDEEEDDVDDSVGEEVTDKFPQCEELEARVFRVKKEKKAGYNYSVTDLDGESFWNEKPIPSISKVNAFLDEYAE